MFETVFIKDETKKTLVVERQFDASKDKVWKAWTDSSMLEKWWAPEPYKAITESFSFTKGGKWHYYMAGPNDEKHWVVIEYETITPEDNYTAVDAGPHPFTIRVLHSSFPRHQRTSWVRDHETSRTRF